MNAITGLPSESGENVDIEPIEQKTQNIISALTAAGTTAFTGTIQTQILEASGVVKTPYIEGGIDGLTINASLSMNNNNIIGGSNFVMNRTTTNSIISNTNPVIEVFGWLACQNTNVTGANVVESKVIQTGQLMTYAPLTYITLASTLQAGSNIDITNLRYLYLQALLPIPGNSSFFVFSDMNIQNKNIIQCNNIETKSISKYFSSADIELKDNLRFGSGSGTITGLSQNITDLKQATTKQYVDQLTIGNSNVKIIESPADLTPPLVGDRYALAPNTTYIFTKNMTLIYGFSLAAGTSVQGLNNTIKITFSEAVNTVFNGNNIDINIRNFYCEGGNVLFQYSNIDTLGDPPFYGRNNQVVVSDCYFLRVRTLGAFIGGIIKISNCLFSGGALTPSLPLTNAGDGFVVGQSYATTSSGAGTGLTVKVLSLGVNSSIGTYQIVEPGINYSTIQKITIANVVNATFSIANTYRGAVGSYTIQGLSITSPTNLEFQNNRMAVFAGVYQLSSAYLLRINTNIIPSIGFFSAQISNNTFYPNSNESGLFVSSKSSSVYSQVLSNLFLGTGTTKNLDYQKINGNYYNSVSLRNYTILSNTNLISSNEMYSNLSVTNYPEYPTSINRQPLYSNLSVNFKTMSGFSLRLTVRNNGTFIPAGYYITNGGSSGLYVVDATAIDAFTQYCYCVCYFGSNLQLTDYTVYTDTLANTGLVCNLDLSFVGPDIVENFHINPIYRFEGNVPSTMKIDGTIQWSSAITSVPVEFGVEINGLYQASVTDIEEVKNDKVNTTFNFLISVQPMDLINLYLRHTTTAVNCILSSFNYSAYRIQ